MRMPSSQALRRSAFPFLSFIAKGPPAATFPHRCSSLRCPLFSAIITTGPSQLSLGQGSYIDKTLSRCSLFSSPLCANQVRQRYKHSTLAAFKKSILACTIIPVLFCAAGLLPPLCEYTYRHVGKGPQLLAQLQGIYLGPL
ncbi:hypothetical protein K437DRAFT_147022 [Tilletiaria anomala UBC 951]|uniref:Uncharacterized protein n=1 Tax=Tilletiaria anomala (strain ATCC 24038 / CBS 436.72 / UBC 951) TaxID=1037660 RepID=A0A066VQ95_TILAU|nr:uncharacterized protein K437DRAFT_147022 [Tilletiaria anomala UBC 951]KDN43656.1 hypothetical protein K437DRAFT_147022 [Tilletiaria anomala UBC 951]